jgi:EmrB/QacA subfamily drug resistance transporter
VSHSTTQRVPYGLQDRSPTSSRASGWLLVSLAVAQLMLVLDVTVANVALPVMAEDLGLSSAATPWAIATYALMLGGFMLVGGRAADVFGSRRVLLAGLSLFTTASLGAALSWSAPSLIATRGAQGLGAAFLSPAALSAITTAYTGPARNRALGVWAAVGGAGASVGVLLGGLLTSGPGWRWIFLVNVPVGVLVFVAVARLLPAQREAGSGSLDLLGGAIVTAATGLVIFGLTRIGQESSFSSIAGLAFAAAILLFASFALRERSSTQPLVDPTTVTKPRILTGVGIMLAASALLIGTFFLLSFYFQRQLGWSAMSTGVAFLPMAVGTLIGAHLGSRALPTHGARAVGVAAFAITAAGLGVGAWEADVPGILMAAAGLAAAGLGAGFVTATTTALGDADQGEVGVVSGLVNTFHELGAAVGVASFSGVVTGGAATGLGSGVGTGLAAAAVTAAALVLLGAVFIPRSKPTAGGPMFMH